MKCSVALLAAAISVSFAHGQDSDDPAKFFPVDEDTGEKGVSLSQVFWYGKHLQRMEEKPLKTFANDADAEIYRFTYLPTWGDPEAFRVHREGDALKIHYLRLDGDGGYDPGKLVESASKELTAKQSANFLRHFEKLDFFNEPSQDPFRGLDGSEWILEAVSKGRYHIVVRWTPQHYNPKKRGTVEFVKTCEWLMKNAPKKATPAKAPPREK